MGIALCQPELQQQQAAAEPLLVITETPCGFSCAMVKLGLLHVRPRPANAAKRVDHMASDPDPKLRRQSAPGCMVIYHFCSGVIWNPASIRTYDQAPPCEQQMGCRRLAAQCSSTWEQQPSSSRTRQHAVSSCPRLRGWTAADLQAPDSTVPKNHKGGSKPSTCRARLHAVKLILQEGECQLTCRRLVAWCPNTTWGGPCHTAPQGRPASRGSLGSAFQPPRSSVGSLRSTCRTCRHGHYSGPSAGREMQMVYSCG